MVDDPKPDEHENDLNPPAASEKPDTGASVPENPAEGPENSADDQPDADSLEAHAAADTASTGGDTAVAETDQHDEYHDDHYHDDHYHDDHYHDDHYTAHDPNHDDGEADPNAMTFLEHLEELRRTILNCLVVLGVGLTITLPFSNKILGWLKWPMEHGLTRRSDRLIKAAMKEAEKAKAAVEAAGTQTVEAAAAVVEPAVAATNELANAVLEGTNEVVEVAATNLAVEVAETNVAVEAVAAHVPEAVELVATNLAESVDAAAVTSNKLALAVQTLARGGEPEMLYDLDKLLHVFDITGGIKLILTIGLWSGVILAAPFMIYFICQFIFPGLKPKEKKVIVGTSGFAVGLFALGVSICYFFTLPFAIDVMFGFTEWVGASTDVIRLNDYVTFCLKLMLGFGLAFELPEVLFVLGYLGLVNSKQLREKRRHVVVGLLFLAMMLTPPDPGTQLMLAVPLFFLFEITIWLIWAKEKSDARRDAAA